MLPISLEGPAAVVLIGSGALACFAGYRLFRVVLAVYGFILGALVGSSLMGTTDPWPMLIAAALGGVAGALILLAAYFVGVALVGAGVGVAVAHLGAAMLSREPHAGVVIACSIVGAFAAISLQRYVVILGTALGGAWTVVVGAATLVGVSGAAGSAARGSGAVWLLYPFQPAPNQRWILAAWLLLGGLGALAQVKGRGGKGVGSRFRRRKGVGSRS